MLERGFSLIFTCEHASRLIPARYREVAERAGAALTTHRGHDPGAMLLAQELAQRFHAPLFAGRYSRLLIELNRSPRHPRLWSEFSRNVSARDKAELLKTYYEPYRKSVSAQIKELARGGSRVLHISVHSFTPVLNGEIRRADIGLLYDPRRAGERSFCARWKAALESADPALHIRRNYPYLGTADGLVTHLRRQFSDRDYGGIELEINQRYPLSDPTGWRKLRRLVADTLASES